MCAKSPGAHGPKCQKKLLACSSPHCNYAVTGLTQKYCCKVCAGAKQHGDNWWGPEHGPQCWRLPAEAPKVEEPAPAETGSGPDDVGADMLCREVDDPDQSSEADGAASASAAAAAAAADPEEAEIRALKAEVQEKQSVIATNEALIKALRDALAVVS